MSYTPNALLDLAVGIGQVHARWRFDLQDQTGAVIGEIQPERSRLSISNTANARIPRTLRGVEIRADEANDLDAFTARVAPRMELEDGTSWPCGVFVFEKPSRALGTWESPLQATLLDLTYQLDQQTDRAISATVGTLATEVARIVVEQAGIFDFELGVSDVRVGPDPIVWPQGSQRGRILDELAQMLGFARPYFDNSGRLVFAALPPLEDSVNVHPYDVDQAGTAPSRVLRSTPVVSPQVDLPGAHLVVNNGATTDDISAIAYVDPSLPWSRERRGFLIMTTHRMQGIETTEQALRIASSLAQQTPEATVQFSGPPDPRHDTFDVVRFGGEGTLYREVSWSLSLSPGGEHKHNLARADLIA